MDKQDLRDILADVKTPPAGDNARKRALNLALAEFENAEKKSQKNCQGFSSTGRLKDITTPDTRRNPMNKKYVYGGLATAMVVVLAVGISYQQLEEGIIFSDSYNPVPSGSDVNDARLASGETVPDTYRQAIEEVNMAGTETNSSAIPVPMAPSPKGKITSHDNNFSNIRGEIKNNFDSLDKKKSEVLTGEGAVYAERHNAERHKALIETEKPANIVATMQSSSPAIGYVVTDNDQIQPGYKDVGRDQFEDFKQNPIKLVREEPVSTFSIDVDTSSYSFMRKQINNGTLPQKDSVRIEEMINYFDYDYPLPENKAEPFKPTVTVAPSPWAEGRELIHIGIKGYDIAPEEKPHSNLVFLLDVSGSMNSQDKLPLLKNSFKLLLDTLEPDDTVGIVVYAGAAGTVLEPTKAKEKSKIINALENLSAGGSTAGAEGIRQAYQLAEENFDKEGVNRIILATDGDFNVGITNREELKDFVERKRETGIFLSVLGFGQGNLNDHMMQTLAQNGNGIAAYIDTLSEARKVLVEEASSTLFPIAKDVKIQVEFNPDTVAEYRLIGYETRALNREDFNNDAVDAGDIGAGHTVTAIYEITPKGGPLSVDESRYAATTEEHKADTDFSDEFAFLKIRYKNPDSDTSKLITTPITKSNRIPVYRCPSNAVCKSAQPSNDTRFAIAVAAFGQILKGGKYTVNYTYDDVIELASGAKGADPFGYRAEFVNLVRLAKSSSAMEKSAPTTQIHINR